MQARMHMCWAARCCRSALRALTPICMHGAVMQHTPAYTILLEIPPVSSHTVCATQGPKLEFCCIISLLLQSALH